MTQPDATDSSLDRARDALRRHAWQQCFELFTAAEDSQSLSPEDLEPHSPSISARFKALEVLASAGIEIGVSISPMLPIVDVESFAVRLATLNAAEYVTQYLKAGHSRFASGTSIDAARRLREDGWGQREYQKTREMVGKTLGIQKRLLEGVEGYAPMTSSFSRLRFPITSTTGSPFSTRLATTTAKG